MRIIEEAIGTIGVVIGVLLMVAYMTVVERKYLSGMQRRRGPNVIGIYGLLQAIADGVKLIVKEAIRPTSANREIFMIAPIITFGVSLIGWAVIPMGEGIVYKEWEYGILYIMGVSGVGIYGIILAGWGSNSKYAMLGALRSTAQMISYELVLGFVVMGVVMGAGTMNLTGIVMAQEKVWMIVPLLPIGIIYMIGIIAETNRHPFDLPEAEAELVSGYNVEYGSGMFAAFFLGEYGNIGLMSAMIVILFIGGWHGGIKGIEPIIMGIKVTGIIIVYIWARGALPRYRYDQLMRICWKEMIPITIGYMMIIVGICY